MAQGKAQYLSSGQGGGVPLPPPMVASLDASVGFSSAPSSAALGSANGNVGVNSVVGAWAYQGSRAAYADRRIMNAQGNSVNSVDTISGKLAWKAEARGKNIDRNSQVFSPPALGAKDMYL